MKWDRDAFIAIVGRERFDRAQTYAFKTAPHCGDRDDGSGSDADESYSLLYDVCNEIITELLESWTESSKDAEDFFTLYRELPSYTALSQLHIQYGNDKLAGDARRRFWAIYREIVSGASEAHARPACYSLWCDWFENQDTVAEAWSEILTPPVDDRRMERVLTHSGPVPFGMKSSVYRELEGDPRKHDWIFRSLLYSAFDVYGNIDKSQALAIVERLEVPETEEKRLLIARLRDATGAGTSRSVDSVDN